MGACCNADEINQGKKAEVISIEQKDVVTPQKTVKMRDLNNQEVTLPGK